MNDLMLASLEEIVGRDNFSTSPTICEAYTHTSGSQDLFRRRPSVVIVPSTAEQVSRILSLANKYHVPVVPRGQMTGFNGESIALEGGIVLDMSYMNRVLEIDEDNMVIVVEGGTTTNQIAHALDEKGLAMPIRPAFAANMQIGGFISNNGTGEYGSIFGRIGDCIKGLEVVLPTGEIVRFGSWAYEFGYGPFTRYPGGPDLLGLFVGSIGSLGVITKVALKAINKHRHVWYGTFGWPRHKVGDMARGMYNLQRYGISTFELRNYWGSRGIDLAGMAAWPGEDVIGVPKQDVLVATLIQSTPTEEELPIKERNTIRILEESGGVNLGPDIAIAGKGWPYYAMSLSIFCRLHPLMPPPQESLGCIEFYHCMPTLKFPEYWDFFEATLRKYGFSQGERGGQLRCFPLDSVALNPYPNFSYRPEDPDDVARMREARLAIQEGCARMGVVTYTVGAFVPRAFLDGTGPTYGILKSVKKMLDPNNILNPGQY